MENWRELRLLAEAIKAEKSEADTRAREAEKGAAEWRLPPSPFAEEWKRSPRGPMNLK